MRKISIITASLLTTIIAAQSQAADSYKADPVHSAVIFSAKHANAGYVWGRFKEVSGTFTLDDDMSKDMFSVEIPVASVDTNNDKRDAHLKSPDWFNAKEYPTIAFKSTAAEKVDDTHLKVTGDLTLHGVTKSISVPVEIVGHGEFPPGTVRSGIQATFDVKMSEFDIKGMPGAVGNEIKVIVALEGVKN